MSKQISVFVILLSIFALTPAPIRAYSRLLPLSPAHADAQISTGEWQKPFVVDDTRFLPGGWQTNQIMPHVYVRTHVRRYIDYIACLSLVYFADNQFPKL